ncbi:2-oxo-4-hydroxy-4-carboxy-5-ureidoimidazoline decarboxylase [Ornithinimicrobium cavernae]|uniref:2-oxo-4-hydroxy-4-carboxy-5-ureidoimidazoline decarboxylase n=1 Tax=Ornithinimicrobium cavernae TaxID=2666047 RepID=UPI001F026EB7|nr:2-oxo-4-hydroxy-4-carboxy-5-ureidoimidazoline decarboxylase [Ornithinimicrobium cavernae]
MTDPAAQSTPRAFNAMTEDTARARVLSCLDVARWAEVVVSGRPYDAWSGLEAAMRTAAATLTDDELAAALARHPRIGERAAAARHEVVHSEREQAGVDRTDPELARQLREGNEAYEERFGRVFLIRAAGRDGPEVLAELRRRLGHTDEQERAETVEQFVQIALLRAREILA